MAILSFLLLVFFLIIGIVYLVRSLKQIKETNKAISAAEHKGGTPPGMSQIGEPAHIPSTVHAEPVEPKPSPAPSQSLPPQAQPVVVASQVVASTISEDSGKPHYTLLKISAPRNNAKSPLAAEQMFSSLHGIYRKAQLVQEHFSFEIAATTQSINFYVLVPTYLKDFIEGQVYAQYPTVEITSSPDYSNVSLDGKAMAAGELTLTKNDIYPIKTFTNFDVDPLAGITGVLSKIEEGEVLAIQAVLSPIDDTWQKEGLEYVKATKEGKSLKPPAPLHVELRKQGMAVLKDVGVGIVQGISGAKPAEKKEEKKEVKLSGPEEVALKGIESKVIKLGFAVTIRILAVAPTQSVAQTRLEAAVGAFKQFNTNNLNAFELDKPTTDTTYLRTFRTRQLSNAPFRLNVEEIASLFHFPDESVQTPNIAWAGSKKGEPPQNLPLESEVPASQLTTFGMTSFRNRRQTFGLKALDRRLHTYIIGKTGTGKSTLIENMIFDDIKEGRGVAVVDPHGELIDHILRFIPEERIKDVVYFNPDDRAFPLAFNLLESVDDDMRNIVASGLMSIFTKLWANVWSARMEYILRNAILAVLEVPDATLLSIMRLLNDDKYRRYVESIITDPVVKDFFVNEYDKYEPKFRQEAIAPIQNKVGQFLSSTTIRNIVGQPTSTFNLSEIMDSGKIFLVNLSIGRIGEDNSKLLGSMMITKIQLAAMGRAKMTEAERRDFYLYVDEFQNFATDSFATILSEARKYHLSLVLVNQYIAQIPEVVADAIFGNVGTMISFRVGATDAEKMVKELAPVFDANDLVNLPNRQIYVKMAIDGVTSQAFSAHTLPPRGVVVNKVDEIIDASRKAYSHDRGEVEAMINASTVSELVSEKDRSYEEMKKYPFIIGDTHYKEFSAKGGARWYFGQLPEDVLAEKGLEPDLPSDGEALPVAEADIKAPEMANEQPEVKAPIPSAEVTSVATELLPSATVQTTEIIAEPVVELLPVKKEESIYQLAAQPVEGDQPKKKKRKRKKKKSSGFSNPESTYQVGEQGRELPSQTEAARPALPGGYERHNISTEAYSTINDVVESPVLTQGEGSEGAKREEPFIVVESRPVNRGHQADDWLPIEPI